MRSLLLRFGVIGACFAIALAIAGGCATKSSLPPVSAATTSWTPVPCVSPGQTGPSCQPTYPGYQYVPPGQSPTPTPTPTATPVTLTPNNYAFTSQQASTDVIISEGSYTGPWSATPPPGGLVTLSITGNDMTVQSPITAAGSGTVTVVDTGSQSAPFTFTVVTPPPTPGPVIISPTSLSFASTGSSAQNITVTESNYTGAFTGACNPSGVVTVGTFSGGVSSVSPVAAGNCTLTVTGGNTASIQVSVSPAPALPTPNLAIATPFGGYSGPTPTQTTFPQLSALTIGAVVKCTTDSTGNAIAGFASAYEFRAGTCNGSTNPVSNVGLQFYDTGNAQGVWPANSLTSGATQAVIAVRDGTTINVYVCPSTASPAYTCGSPTTFSNSGTIATGTEPGYIGAGSNGTAELMTGDIWNFWLGPNLNATQVQQLAYQIGVPDPYPTAPPGPLSAAPASAALPAPTATATSIITDPGCGGCTFSVSPVPVGVVSASIASGVVTITGNGTLCASNCSVNVSDGGYNTLAIPVTVSPTPVTVPAPVFTATAPGTTYPITETLPMTPSITVTAVIQCLATANNGAAIISGAGNFSMSAGLCNGSSQTNPTNGTGMHFYDSTGSGAQAPSTSTSSNSLNTGSKYYIAGNVDAVNHLTNFYYCVLPYTLNNCVQYQSSDTTSAFPTGNITGYIGAASDGTSRNATGFLNIWDVGLYNIALSPQQVNVAAAAAPSGNPYPTPTPTAGGVGSYAFVANPRESSPQNTYVFAAHPGASPTPIGIVGQLVGTTVAAHILSGPGSAANVNYYNYASSHGSGYIYGWDNNSIYANPTRTNNSTGSIEGPWSATTSDPVWQIYAIDSCNGGSSYGCTANSTVPLGPSSGACGYSGNCGYANGITNVYIPYGAVPENYGSGQCDCHLFVTQPYGWVPTFRTGSPGASKTWPDVSGGGKMPFYYTIELENAFKQYTCSNASTAACAQYEPGGTLSSPQTLWTHGIIAISTAQGFYNASQNNYGFPTASMCSAAGINASFCTPPGTGFYGGGTHGSTPFMAQMISSTDATNGHINHQIGIGMVCLNASASNVWPGPTTQTDHPGETDCSVISGGSSTVGYTYDGHGTLLEPNGSGGYRLATMADICTVSSGSWAIGKTCTSGDALGGSLTIGTITYTWPRFDATSSGAGANVYGPLMTAEALLNYGATFVDTAGTYGPTYAGRINGGDAGWNAAAAAWGISLSGSNYTVKFGLPYQYMASHFAEFDSCAVPGNPNGC